MAETKIDIELDPKNFKKSIDDLIEAVKNLSTIIEGQLGREAPRSFQKLEESAEKGTSKIKQMFKDLGEKVKDSLKNAFNVAAVAGGFKLGKELISGVKEVFDLEKAFDKLNSRLQLTGRAYQDFKKQIGTSVASTGQKIEDIFPGVEVAASKGNIKSTKDLSIIAQSLGEAKATTGEETESLADTITEILKNQNKKITGESFKETLNALQATRVTGAFKTAGEAGSTIKSITHGISADQLKKMGLDTRELGGLAAAASKGGEQGPEILNHLLNQAANQAGGANYLNKVLGVNLFDKKGKLQAGEFQKINKNRFGQYSEQALASATGADQAGLSRFLDTMKTSMADFSKVTKGANETADQFKIATDNLASGVDQFKEKTKNVGREIGDDLAEAAQDLLKGNYEGALEKAKGAGQTIIDNKSLVAGATGAAGLAAVLTGGGIDALFKKSSGGGLGGSVGDSVMGGLLGGKTSSEGATPVYVVNAAEIRGTVASITDKAVKVVAAAAIGGAGYLGYKSQENDTVRKATSPVLDYVSKKLGIDMPKANLDLTSKGSHGLGLTPESIASAVSRGTEQGVSKSNKSKQTQYTNPSSISGRGASL